MLDASHLNLVDDNVFVLVTCRAHVICCLQKVTSITGVYACVTVDGKSENTPVTSLHVMDEWHSWNFHRSTFVCPTPDAQLSVRVYAQNKCSTLIKEKLLCSAGTWHTLIAANWAVCCNS